MKDKKRKNNGIKPVSLKAVYIVNLWKEMGTKYTTLNPSMEAG